MYVRSVHEALDAFSSDDEQPPPVSESRGSRKSRSSGTKKSQTELQSLDLTVTSDEDLRKQLLQHQDQTGAIADSTQKLYEGKLLELLDNGSVQSQSPGSDPGLGLDVELDNYSDHEEELLAAPESEPTADEEDQNEEESVKISSSRTSSRHSAAFQVEQATLDPPASEEIFTFTQLSATCRKPIKGAAGRPIANDWNRSIICDSAPSVTGPAPSVTGPASSAQPWGKRLLLLVVLIALIYILFQFVEQDAGDDEL